MDSVKIKALLKSIELGSLTKAAEELGYTQAGLTHMMNRLENEIGLPILKRNKSGVQLTDDGERLLPYFKEFLVSSEHLDKSIEEAVKGVGDTLKIGTYTSILKMWLPSVINGFREISPDIKIEICDSSIVQLYNRVASDELDAAFVSRQDSKECRFIPLKKDPFYAVLPEAETRYDNCDTVPITVFDKVNFIMPTFGYDPDILSALQENNVKPVFNATSVDDVSVTALVEIGLGVSILPELVLKSINTSKVKVKKLSPSCSRELGIIVSQDKIKSPLVRSFIRYSEQVINDF